MNLRRGFKSESNRWSRDLRHEMNIRFHDPICPWKLCEHLEIPVISTDFFALYNPEHVLYLYSEQGRSEFSALTLDIDGRRHIIHNSSHNIKRQASNISHEIAHALLMHPIPLMLDKHGNRIYNVEIEDEANWLGPALLISDEAAMHIVESKMSIHQASDYFSVTKEVIQMRINVSGARKRAA